VVAAQTPCGRGGWLDYAHNQHTLRLSAAGRRRKCSTSPTTHIDARHIHSLTQEGHWLLLLPAPAGSYASHGLSCIPLPPPPCTRRSLPSTVPWFQVPRLARCPAVSCTGACLPHAPTRHGVQGSAIARSGRCGGGRRSGGACLRDSANGQGKGSQLSAPCKVEDVLTWREGWISPHATLTS
jgi:hypothetical protein